MATLVVHKEEPFVISCASENKTKYDLLYMINCGIVPKNKLVKKGKII